MDFVLTLHSHLPWVLHHGRWPHGSDWLCEAAVDTYLPLVEALRALERLSVHAPVTMGVTPILANQLDHVAFPGELEAFFTQRMEACAEAERDFAASGEIGLIHLSGFWRQRLGRLRDLFRDLEGDIVGEVARLGRAGRIELISSAATHGFLPLLARDESVRLQLDLGRREHRRLFGADPTGCWLPECAYRNAGRWAPHPLAPASEQRPGLETFLAEAGYRYFFTDAHLAEAGSALGLYGETDFVDGMREPDESSLVRPFLRSPYRSYRVGPTTAFVRDPESSLRVWSRHHGYPGDGGYLEFHKIRWPGGLRLWRVTGTEVDLGAKERYDPNLARARAYRHAREFAGLLVHLARRADASGGEVVVAPFDTELFGHWWFEGVDFLGDLFRALGRQEAMHPRTASQHRTARSAARPEGQPSLRLADGSWGANGDYSKWLNPLTEWTWTRMWGLEERFWNLAHRGVPAACDAKRQVWEQAARELLLAQASDWQFIISTGAAADYAERRFREHCDGLDAILDGLSPDTPEATTSAAVRARTLHERDDPFPDVLPSLEAALGGGR